MSRLGLGISLDTECTPTLLDVQALGKVPGDYSKGFWYLCNVTIDHWLPIGAMQLIGVKQIPVRKVMPGQEGSS